ncbi:MAG: transglutaminaseTgpA domain-containing protein, partial [Chthoniobacteraceae bacterium]
MASWTILMFLGCAATRLYYARRGWRLPSIWIKLVALAVGVCGIAVTYGTIVGIEAGLSVLLILVSLKTLETASARDL